MASSVVLSDAMTTTLSPEMDALLNVNPRKDGSALPPSMASNKDVPPSVVTEDSVEEKFATTTTPEAVMDALPLAKRKRDGNVTTSTLVPAVKPCLSSSLAGFATTDTGDLGTTQLP